MYIHLQFRLLSDCNIPTPHSEEHCLLSEGGAPAFWKRGSCSLKERCLLSKGRVCTFWRRGGMLQLEGKLDCDVSTLLIKQWLNDLWWMCFLLWITLSMAGDSCWDKKKKFFLPLYGSGKMIGKSFSKLLMLHPQYHGRIRKIWGKDHTQLGSKLRITFSPS